MKKRNKKKFYFYLIAGAIIWGGVTTPITSLVLSEPISVPVLCFNVTAFILYTIVAIFVGLNLLNIGWDVLIPENRKEHMAFFYPLLLSPPLLIIGIVIEWLKTGNLPL